jgi:hypothetical protein
MCRALILSPSSFSPLFMNASAAIADSPLRQANVRLRRHVGGRTDSLLGINRLF